MKKYLIAFIVILSIGALLLTSPIVRLWIFGEREDDARQITHFDSEEHLPIWSPDGKKIAFLRYELSSKAQTLWLIEVGREGKLIKLASDVCGEKWHQEPKWSSTSTMIAYASGDSYELSLVVLSLENRKKLKVIHNYRNHSTSTFCWNPRGEEIAYEAEGGDIWIASIKEGWEMQFTSGKGVKRHPTWSKQGKIAFSWDKEGNFDIWEKDDSGFGDAIQITQTPEDERCPIYSPSGERLMYIGKRGGIFVISLKDRGIIEVLKSRPFGGKVCWAPDGVRIAYDIFSRFGNYRNIWIVQIGNAPRRVGGLYLTKKKYSIKIATNRDPTWSQDGQKLAFTSDREGNENIYVIEVPLN